jgi:hypothetical protein
MLAVLEIQPQPYAQVPSAEILEDAFRPAIKKCQQIESAVEAILAHCGKTSLSMSATISAYRSVRLDKNKPRREGGALMPFACSTTSFLLTEHEGSQQRCQLDRLFWSNSDLGEFNDDQEHRTRHRDCTYKSDGSCNFQPSIGRVSSWRFGGSQSCCAGCFNKGKVPAPHCPALPKLRLWRSSTSRQRHLLWDRGAGQLPAIRV